MWFLLTLLLHFGQSWCQVTKGLFVRSPNISLTNWTSAIQTNTFITQTLMECGSYCLQHDSHETNFCNSFQFAKDEHECTLGKVAFLEDTQKDVQSVIFHVNQVAAQELRLYCHGSEHCCRPENQCDRNEGDCNTHEDCKGTYLCGTDNCLNLGVEGRGGGNWDDQDDCCERLCTPDRPCLQGQGDCDTNNDCQRPTWMSCVHDSCSNNQWFPLDTYPNNTMDVYLEGDDCCLRNCRPDARCNHDQEGCETDADCKDGIECLESGFCKDIDECSEAVGTGLTHCGENANCINQIGSFRCECHSGYENHVANVGCSDINECLQNPAPGCAKRTACTNLDGSHECVCRDGYTGDPHSACHDIGKSDLDS